jgi:hypothetical protein
LPPRFRRVSARRQADLEGSARSALATAALPRRPIIQTTRIKPMEAAEANIQKEKAGPKS